MKFEFNYQPCPQGLITIDDIGQCAIEGMNEDKEYFHLIIRSSKGMATVVKFGPVVPGVDFLPSGYSTTLTRIPSETAKLRKTIDSWLLKNLLVEAKPIPLEEALDYYRDIGEYMYRYDGEGVY